MGRKAFVVRVGPELRERLDQKIDDGAETIDDLTSWLQTETGDKLISRSAVGRYAYSRRTRARAMEALSEMAATSPEGGQDEALDLTMELATLRIREARVLDRLRALGVV